MTYSSFLETTSFNRTNITIDRAAHRRALYTRKSASIIVGIGFLPFVSFVIIFCRVIPEKCAELSDDC